VKRKYKTNNDGKIARWWYILHAEEAQLNQLEQEWMGEGTSSDLMEA